MISTDLEDVEFDLEFLKLQGSAKDLLGWVFFITVVNCCEKICKPPKFAFWGRVDSVEKLFRVFWEMDFKLQIAVKMCNLRVTSKFAFMGARFCLIRI